MSHERQQLTREGIAPRRESGTRVPAAEQRRYGLVQTSPEAQPDSALGGTSDGDSPADDTATTVARTGDQQ